MSTTTLWFAFVRWTFCWQRRKEKSEANRGKLNSYENTTLKHVLLSCKFHRSGSRTKDQKSADWSSSRVWVEVHSSVDHGRCVDFQWIYRRVGLTSLASHTSPVISLTSGTADHLSTPTTRHSSPDTQECLSTHQVSDNYDVLMTSLIKFKLISFSQVAQWIIPVRCPAWWTSLEWHLMPVF